jgi:hypothetical protein
MSNSIAWTEEKKILVHFKKLLDNGDLDHVVVRSKILAHKKREHATVDDEVWFLLAKRASAEWRLQQDLEGVALPNRRFLLSVQSVSLPRLRF